MLWFRETLVDKGLQFQWRNSFPAMEMRHVLHLLNSINLISETEYGKFHEGSQKSNYFVHHICSQWEKEKSELQKAAKLILECIHLILTRPILRPS